MQRRTVAVLAGDGIGPEITAQAQRVLRSAAMADGLELDLEPALVGGAAYDACGHPLPEETLALCRRAQGVLFGAVGGPKWDAVQPPSMRPELGGLLALRKALGLFANLRPVRLYPALAGASALKAELVREGLDVLIVRELTGGIYFGEPRGRSEDGTRAFDTCVYTAAEVERVARAAFEAASRRRGQVCSVDKANVLETSRLWRETVSRVAADYPGVELTHMLVDNCAMQLVRDPRQFDVIVTENLFGDILSDEAAMLTGSLGMLPSASLGEAGAGLYEPIHGSAPDIAGKGVANPLAAILSAALLLRYSLAMEGAARRIELAVEAAVGEGSRTADLGGSATTLEMGDQVMRALEAQPAA